MSDNELNSPGYDIPDELDNAVKITTLDRLYNWGRRSSVWPMMPRAIRISPMLRPKTPVCQTFTVSSQNLSTWVKKSGIGNQSRQGLMRRRPLVLEWPRI